MKKIFLFFAITIVALLNTELYAQVDSDLSNESFEEYRKSLFEDFDDFREEAIKEYNEYAEAMHAEYMEYLSSIKSMWGENNAAEDTKTEWVEYGNDLKSRSIVNFEKGKIDVEILLDNVNDNDSTAIKKRLAEAIKALLNSKGKTLPYKSQIDEQLTLSPTPILEGLVDFSKYDIPKEIASKDIKQIAVDKPKKPTPPTPVVKSSTLTDNENKEEKNSAKTTMANEAINKKKKAEEEKLAETKIVKNEPIVNKEAASTPVTNTPKEENKKVETLIAENIAKAIAEQSKKSSNTIKGEDNIERKVIKIEMPLVSDNLSKNAAIYKDYVEQYSQKFKIEQPLIYAVMEQESCFNPKAKSWVPAYGLMQLVPSSGGYDAYRYVYKNDWIPTQSYLYIPHQNIELGTAYLRILMNQFSNVTNPDCRRLCVIASYNTGAGNVSRAFTGNTNIKKAIPLINEYSYQQLYDYLTNKLSTEEARKYVSGVSKRREKYLK